MKQLNPLNGLIIGLTGGIACGKSTVTQLLQRRGADIIDLDQIGHELLKANSPVMKQLLKTFGPEVLDLSGDVNRTKSGKTVFCNFSITLITLLPVGVCTVKHLAATFANEVILFIDELSRVTCPALDEEIKTVPSKCCFNSSDTVS